MIVNIVHATDLALVFYPLGPYLLDLNPLFALYLLGYKIHTLQMMSETFDLLNLNYLIKQNSSFKISKLCNIGLPRYRNYKIRICGKDSVPLDSIASYFTFYFSFIYFIYNIDLLLAIELTEIIRNCENFVWNYKHDDRDLSFCQIFLTFL